MVTQQQVGGDTGEQGAVTGDRGTGGEGGATQGTCECEGASVSVRVLAAVLRCTMTHVVAGPSATGGAITTDPRHHHHHHHHTCHHYTAELTRAN